MMMFELWRRNRGLLRWLRQMRRGWLGVVLNAWRQTFALESSLTAAAIAYFSLFSFFPLLVFTTMIAGTWLSPILDQSEIIAQFNFLAPALGFLLENQLQRIADIEQRVTGFAALSLIWSASSIFYVMTRTLDRIWNVVRRRPLWQHRGMALASVLGISALLLLTSLIHGTVVTVATLFMPAQLEYLTRFGTQVAAAAISILLFAILYRFLPNTEVSWRDVWIGAVVGGLLWEVVKRIFFFYATNYLAQPNLTQLIYGSLAAIIAFLAWAYVSSILLIFGAYLNVGFYQQRLPPAEAAQIPAARR
jgi:membrane protein